MDNLHSRVSPQAIKNDLKGYARDTGQQFLHNMETRARENPLQTVAIAAGLAYPMWRVICNIPAPILLVGAGLAMARRNGGSGNGAAGHDAYNAVAAKAGATADAVKEKAAEVVDSARSRLQSVGTQAADATEEVYQATVFDVKEQGLTAEAARNAVRDVADRAGSAVDKTAEALDAKPPKASARRIAR